MRRSARLALHRGELVDGAEANRLAAAQARVRLREPKPGGRGRGLQAFSGGTAALAWTLLVAALVLGEMSPAIMFAGTAITGTAVAFVAVPARSRTRRRSERVAALYAVDGFCARSAEPGDRCRSL
ncbi:hypothetical protein [Streptomonospora litoralis]|nr:hypothetical protein [Streptomonospora litoralis]